MNTVIEISKLADAAKQEVAGILASQSVDRDGEVFDYDRSKAHFQTWSDNLKAATSKIAGEENASLGNVRLMHNRQTVGKLTSIVFDDEKKTIWGIAKITDSKIWSDIQKGVYSAFSVAGNLVSSVWKAGRKWITVEPLEVSVVDYPSNPDTTFQWARGAGLRTCPVMKFADVEKHHHPEEPAGVEVDAEGHVESSFVPDADPGKNEIPVNPNDQVKKVAPAGWEDTVIAMKEHPEIDNPWALAHWMDDEGFSPSKAAVSAAVHLCSVAKSSGLKWTGALALASGFKFEV